MIHATDMELYEVLQGRERGGNHLKAHLDKCVMCRNRLSEMRSFYEEVENWISQRINEENMSERGVYELKS